MVISPPNWDGKDIEAAWVEAGTMVNSGQFNGMPSEKAFDGITYTIEKYTDKDGLFIPKHEKHGLTHILRHARATNLIMDYGLDGVDVGIMLGWSNPGLPNMARRYVVMEWRRYFPKLLKEYKNA